MRFRTILFFLFFSLLLQAQVTLVPWGANWKYLDDGSNQGSQWTQPSYNDGSWASGAAELGYGDGDETTVVGYGPSSSNKYITTYFRHTFNVSNPAQFSSLLLSIVRDDGAVVYVNGTEVYRNNMPSGTINYLTQASSTIAFIYEDDIHTATISPLVLVPGNNVIAVEIHQDVGTSSDISFNFQLEGSTTPVIANVVRGPYLQMATPNSIIVRWRTDVATDSRVEYGLTSVSLNQSAAQASWSTEHEVLLTGLSPATLYYYSIGSSGGQFTPSVNQYFKTNPVIGTEGPYRFWAVGDAGTGDQNQLAVRNAFYQQNGSPHVDGWIMLGDNAYDNGYDSQYQTGIFNATYQPTMENTPIWPAPGNHDYNNHIPFSPSPAYYDIFNLPANGEAGGVPSGTEKYYSWDYGNVHFIVLDSYDEGRAPGDAMALWLQADLAATTQQWIVAYWHHPPYTKGSHDSDDPFLNGELIDMRSNILPILENGGVDLVLCGHSHSYERSFLLDGHYGYSNTLNSSMVVDGGSGSYPVDCPYEKNTIINRSHKGAVYAVIGCSGKVSSVSSDWPHPAMYTSDANDYGSLLLDVNANRLDATFLTANYTVYDHFTIIKNAGVHQTLSFCPGDTLVLHASWPGAHTWFPGNNTGDSLLIAPVVPTVYFVHDSTGCIQDTFSIELQVSPACPPMTTIMEQTGAMDFRLSPLPVKAGDPFEMVLPAPAETDYVLRMTDISGRVVFEQTLLPGVSSCTIPGASVAGVYFIVLSDGVHSSAQKMIVY